jgi:hypothetical protein
MENYTKNVIDNKSWTKGVAASENHVRSASNITVASPTNRLPQISDFTLTKSNGQVVKGADEALKELAEVIYAPFPAHKHDPTFLCTFDRDDGWEMIGVATVYFKLQGGPGNAVKDPQGESWDGSTPGAFHFEYVKEGDGIKLRKTSIFSDPSPALRLMLQAGALNGEQIAGMLLS